MDINVFHAKLGHPDMMVVKRTAIEMGLHLTGEVKPCEDCALAKARQKNVNKLKDVKNKMLNQTTFAFSKIYYFVIA